VRILLIEDDFAQADQLVGTLASEGHDVVHEAEGDSALKRAQTDTFDVLIVDRMLPKMDGLSIVTKLREDGDQTPALILSALSQVDDRVEGLRAGGDDYLTKPYASSELLARLEVLAKRGENQSTETMLEVGDLKLDRIHHTAKRAGADIELKPREYRLLEYLMNNEGKVVTRTMLLQNVWDLNFDPQTNVIDVHMSRLRSKLDKEFEFPLLHTVRGRGYKLADLSDSGTV
jgi:two-component system OmpR family response regulator